MPDISSIGGTSTANQDVIRALKDHLHDTDFNRWVPSEAMSFENITEVVALPGCSGASFVKAQANAITRLKIYRPSYWTNGAVKVRLYFVGTVAAKDDIRIVFRAHAYAPDSVFSAFAVNVAEVLSGPLLGVQESEYEFAAQLPVDASHNLLVCRIMRDGTHADDTYAGDFILMGALLTYVPARQ